MRKVVFFFGGGGFARAVKVIEIGLRGREVLIDEIVFGYVVFGHGFKLEMPFYATFLAL